MKLDPSGLPSDVVNRTLGREAWARDKLAAHAGRMFTVSIGPATAGFRIADDGMLENAPLAGGVPDLRLTVSPLKLAAFLADPRQWNEHVEEEGDVALGGTLKELAQTLPWFVEQAAARVFGPIAGQRVADAGRNVLSLPGYAAERIAESIGRYARDEVRYLARGDEMRRFAAETIEVSARTEALGARIDSLGRRMADMRSVE